MEVSSKSALFLQGEGKGEGKEGIDLLTANIIHLIKSNPNIIYSEILKRE